VLTFAIFGEVPDAAFTEIGKELEDELERISGVSDITIAGLREREVQVVLKPEALRAYGLTNTDVTTAISRANATLPIGAITFDGVSYNLEFDAKINDPSEIGDIAILEEGGAPVYIRDVADVINGFTETRSLSRVSKSGAPSAPALTVNVIKQGGGNVTEITTAVRERLEELRAPGEALAGLDVLIIFDTGELLIEDLTSLTQSGVLAIILVTLILLFTIGWRESLVAGLAIPLSFMLAFVGLYASGNTLNFVSLFALILSVGILVDSAIVITEGIHTNMKTNPTGNKRDAALKTIRDFHAPVTAGTMTTVAVFVPLFFISGIVGQFIKSIPFTIISVLLASLLVALGFVPLIASIFLRRRTTSRLEAHQEAFTERTLNWYKGVLRQVLGNRRRENLFLATIIGLFFATPVLPIKGVPAAIVFGLIAGGAIFLLLTRRVRWFLTVPGVIIALVIGGFAVSFMPRILTMPVEFFPSGDEDYLIVEMELPEGTVLDVSDVEARRIEEILYTEPDIQSFVMTAGAGSAFTGTGGSSGAKRANAFIELREDRDFTSLEVGDRLTEKLAVIKTSDIRVTQISNGPPVGTPVVITFKGDDREELERLAVEAARILRDIPGTNAVTTSTKNDNSEFVLSVDRAEVAALGLNPSSIAATLRTAIEGSEATTINTNDKDIEVIVTEALNPDYRDPHDTNQITIDRVRGIELQTPRGAVLLGSLIDTKIQKGSTAIRHEDESRVATAASELAEDGNAAEITRIFRERAATELTVPAGVAMIVGGENEETDQSFAEMGYAIIAGLILMFTIIVLMFNSFRHAVYVIAPAFFSFIGVSLGLTITGNALSFPSLMGLIALIGIVVNNSIILINVMNGLRREHPNWSIETAVVDGAASRLRPILLTTITTVIGIIPLLFTASFWAPLALAIIFGLSFSVLITLLFIPILYLRGPGEVG
jgi:multidrug efflux pump subunit AcrB